MEKENQQLKQEIYRLYKSRIEEQFQETLAKLEEIVLSESNPPNAVAILERTLHRINPSVLIESKVQLSCFGKAYNRRIKHEEKFGKTYHELREELRKLANLRTKTYIEMEGEIKIPAKSIQRTLILDQSAPYFITHGDTMKIIEYFKDQISEEKYNHLIDLTNNSGLPPSRRYKRSKK